LFVGEVDEARQGVDAVFKVMQPAFADGSAGRQQTCPLEGLADQG
jgi:hypothetical protein